MRLIDRRLGLLFCIFCLIFSFAIARSFWLQGVKGGTLRAEARSQQVTTVTIPGERGRVLDRNGKVLAASEDAADVIATPYQVDNPGQTALRLHEVLGVPTADLLKSLSDRTSGFAYLDRKVDPDVAARVKKLDITGISTVPNSRRLYPQGELASQVIGAVGTDNQGLTGLEHSENSVLGGANGEQDVVHDALGRPLRMQTVTPASVGEDVQTTLDAAIQDKTEQALNAAVQQYQAKGATAIVMNPNTGEVLAMANTPGFDPENLQNATPEQLQNRATGFTYEPGSTFKAFTVASALEDHVVTPHSSFYLPSQIHVYDRTIGEAEARPPETLTTAQILAQSSNVGAITIGLKEGADRFSQWISRFGFGQPTGVGYPGEERGIVPARDQYSGATMGNLPIGQGLSVTPMQMATAYSAIADGGILRRPTLIKDIGGQPTDANTDPHRVITARTASQLRRMLEGVLEPGGTASSVHVPGYVLAGKTGTAQKVVNGKYSNSEYVASFVGFAPARHPQLLVAVVVDQPLYVHVGGAVAAPVFGQIASFALPYLGISPR
ncbi:MAG TPA: penicillin-binding protein 2 [Solirubrobacterales bacterium]|jgi:cell division protein FtsI/penicillin-binding protein 2|nr:penicillin-binding protein 2 [Solirubrobacterales bacterium]